MLSLVLTLGMVRGPDAQAEPPAWQRELDATRLAGVTAALASPAEAAEAEHRLTELYRRLAARYPDQAAVRKAAGDHFWKVGDTAAATAEWLTAQTLAPDDAATASALGSAWLREGRTDAARGQFQRAVDAQPGVARYHFDLANVLFLFRHQFPRSAAVPDEAAALQGALGHFRRASELAPDNVEFARAYAETFYGVPQPDWTQGLAAWEHVRTLTAAKPDYANGHLARISLKLGQPEQAEGYLESIRDPAFAPLKAKLRQQVEQMKPGNAAPTP